ncbi:MAG: hypothetical protein KKC79_20215 [Gammaproteobacteria bacterium]|nr:hypothetical protein [Gammaproteobacteria bacterium]MBU1441718.1 hypothetical protein [Gammaproteobacteria bacterium]MBU2287957.1 hypothetical protein [Gammaproteobacteria bacterium]MBU2410962.1 hypothetical protein [Gammaproteobacteria bacterium]
MTLTCPRCNTENRAIAKFCIECVNALPSRLADADFGPTAQALRAPRGFGRRGASSALASFVKPLEAEPSAEKSGSLGWMLRLAVLVAALCVGAAAWYAYRGDASVDDVALPSAHATALVDTGSGAAASRVDAATAPAVSAEPTQLAAQSVAAETPSPVGTSLAAAAPTASTAPPIGKPTKPARTAKPSPAPSTTGAVAKSPTIEAVAPVPSTPASPPVVAEPRAQCQGMNFISAARCMAAQCLRSEFKPHAQCEAVRRQQRLEEEKRNPTLAD